MDFSNLRTGVFRFFLNAALALSAAGYAVAVETAAGRSVMLGEAIEEDVLVAGQHVQIKSPVKGDVAAAGSEVYIEEPIAGYVMAAGKTIELNGRVADDFWAAAAAIHINRFWSAGAATTRLETSHAPR